MPETKKTEAPENGGKKKMRFSKKRGIVVGIVFASVLVGLVVHSGTGTESALGWRDIAVLCPVGALEVLAGNHGLALHALILLAVAAVIALVFGKSFCGWFCPTPYVRKIFGVKHRKNDTSYADMQDDAATDLDSAAEAGDMIDANAQAALQNAAEAGGVKALPPVGGKRDGLRLDSRHFVLAGALGSSFIFGFPVFCLVCPVGISFAIVIGVFNLVRFADTSWGLLVFPILLVLELVVFRKWCTHLCPISALLSLVSSRTRRAKPRVDGARCLRRKGTDCRVCVEECPERVDPHTLDIPECSNCGICADKCPAQAISIKLGKLELRK